MERIITKPNNNYKLVEQKLEKIIGEKNIEIPTKYGVLYIGKDSKYKNEFNAKILENKIRTNNPTSNKVLRKNNRYNNNGVIFKKYKQNKYITEWQMPVDKSLVKESNETNFVIVTETKASKKKGGLGMQNANFECDDPLQMQKFKEYPPFDRFKLNRLLAVGRWVMMEGHMPDGPANERGIVTEFKGIKDYEILSHKEDIVKKNRLASWYMEQVYSKDTGLLDKFRKLLEDRKEILTKEQHSSISRIYPMFMPPLAPYRSRQTVAELLRTCQVIKDIPERKQLRFDTTGLGAFNDDKASVFGVLMKGLRKEDIHDDHGFLLERDFLVSRPLHETKIKSGYNINGLFASNNFVRNENAYKKANLELMGAAFPTPYNDTAMERRHLRDFECLSTHKKKEKGNYPQLPSDNSLTFCQAVRDELYHLERIGALKVILNSKFYSIFFDVMDDNVKEMHRRSGTYRLAIPREFYQKGKEGYRNLILDGFIKNMRDDGSIYVQDGKYPTKNKQPPLIFAKIHGEKLKCEFEELQESKNHEIDVYGWHEKVVQASLKLQQTMNEHVASEVCKTLSDLFNKKLPFVKVSKYDITDNKGDTPASSHHAERCIIDSDRYQRRIDKMHSPSSESQNIMLSNNSKSGYEVDIEWGHLRYPHLYFLFIINVYNVNKNNKIKESRRFDPKESRRFDPRVYSANQRDYMTAMKKSSIHKREFLFTMMNLCYCPFSVGVKTQFRGHSLSRIKYLGKKSNRLYKGDLISMSRCIPSFISTTNAIHELRQFFEKTNEITEKLKKVYSSGLKGTEKLKLLEAFGRQVYYSIVLVPKLPEIHLFRHGRRRKEEEEHSVNLKNIKISNILERSYKQTSNPDGKAYVPKVREFKYTLKLSSYVDFNLLKKGRQAVSTSGSLLK